MHAPLLFSFFASFEHGRSRPRLAAVALFAALTVTLASACATTDDGGNNGPTAADYLPLKVGNAWTYEITSPGSPEPITERIEILHQDSEGFFVDSKGVRFRSRGDGIFDGHRFLLQPPLQVGHKWLAVPSPTEVERYEIIGMRERIAVKAGSFDNCVRVRGTQETKMHDGTPATLTTEWTWAKDVGLIRMEQSVTIGSTPAVKGIALNLVSFEEKASEDDA